MEWTTRFCGGITMTKKPTGYWWYNHSRCRLHWLPWDSPWSLASTPELRTQNFIWQHYGHIGGDRFINASRFSNGWYWNKAGEYSLTRLTKKYNLQRLNKKMMPYLVGVMLSWVPLRHIAAIIGPLTPHHERRAYTSNFVQYISGC